MLRSLGYVTYTPRLLLVDLKGSLGHLPEKGELYEQPLANPEIVPWPREKVEVLTEPTTTKNEFLQDIDEENVMDQDDGHTSKTVVQDALKVYKLENVVKVWADYLRQRFHPRTVSIVNKYEHANDSQPFNNYKLGANLWNTEQFEEDFTDRIRNLVEECDNMQEHIKSVTGNEVSILINLGTRELHVVHSSLRTGVEPVNWDINCLLSHTYYLFTDYSSSSIVYPVDRVSNFFFRLGHSVETVGKWLNSATLMVSRRKWPNDATLMVRLEEAVKRYNPNGE
uniref:Uncharacterized protein n=1 Tax=Timema bartmani TaxID=61472 RepID=A0A7R9EWD8_9NEOP|nr:unnamed protein product [Timema bartmani]